MERNMDRQRIEEAYRRWTQMASEEDVAAELAEMGQDEKGKEDAFYRELAFGTGGLRGVIGADDLLHNGFSCYDLHPAAHLPSRKTAFFLIIVCC